MMMSKKKKFFNFLELLLLLLLFYASKNWSHKISPLYNLFKKKSTVHWLFDLPAGMKSSLCNLMKSPTRTVHS